jgi:hypothetical protein
MKLKQNSNVETGVVTKMVEDILERKKCRRSQLDLEESGSGKEADLYIHLMTVRLHTLIDK